MGSKLKGIFSKLTTGDFEGFFSDLVKSKVVIASTLLGLLMVVQEYQELFPEKVVHWSGLAIALLTVLFRASTQVELSKTRNQLKKTRPEAREKKSELPASSANSEPSADASADTDETPNN